jgi:glycine/sarcosine N-methyltransferase
MYDDFSADYDRFVNWPARLAAELPFLEQQLQAVQARRVLDAACGTGMHAITLTQRGYEMVGADFSPAMIARARANAAAAGVNVHFAVAGFGTLAQTFSPSPSSRRGEGEGAGVRKGVFPFDALLCLGNSLPHLLTPVDLAMALLDFAACLQPGGLLVIQNRNFDAVLASGERWLEPQAHREGETEWLFLRFYDFERDGTVTFNLVTLRREGTGEWSQQVRSTRLWPQRRDDLVAALTAAGFGDITCWGDMQGMPFDADHSPNLVVAARKL